MTRDTVPENFTLSLAAIDAIPVLFFGATMILIGAFFSNPLFLIGAIVVFVSGLIKVLWKVDVVIKKRNTWWMFLQMRIAMPIGFLIMIIGLVMSRKEIVPAVLISSICSLPSVIFFSFGIIGMILMIVFAVKLDSSDVKSNWIEQATNGIAQIAFFVGVLLLVI